MRIFCLILLVTVGWFYLARSAVPINELVINRIFCNNSRPLFECNFKLQRKNKTSQELRGNYTLKMPWTTNISATLVMSYQDYSGIWKGYIQRNFDDTCKIFFTPKGLLANQRKKYMPVCEEGCPSEPQFCTAGPAIVNRYRKDWEEDLKFWIPPYFMEADNWKVYGKAFYKDDPNNILAELTFEYRLLNERMSQ